jgi:hypothetical protein
MGTIISLVIFGAVYCFIYIAKNFSPAPKEEGMTFGENFPTVEILEPAEEPAGEEPVKEMPTVVQPAPAKVAVQKRPDVDRSPQTRSPEVPVSAKKERLIRLDSKSEAKRAFLYSEIFNRKY